MSIKVRSDQYIDCLVRGRELEREHDQIIDMKQRHAEIIIELGNKEDKIIRQKERLSETMQELKALGVNFQRVSQAQEEGYF